MDASDRNHRPQVFSLHQRSFKNYVSQGRGDLLQALTEVPFFSPMPHKVAQRLRESPALSGLSEKFVPASAGGWVCKGVWAALW